MEIKANSEEKKLYEKILNNWNIILDFLDINTLFQIETASKFFRNRLLFYYESKETLLKNFSSENNKPSDEQEKKEYIINFKKKFLSKYFNLLVNIDIEDIKFCNEGNDETFLNIVKKPFTKIESILFKRT